MPLVYTTDGVQDAPEIDADALKALAKFFCEDELHDRLPQQSDLEYESAVDLHGYCDRCRDFAGGILARFNVTERGKE